MDVSFVESPKRIARYVSKYITKSTGNWSQLEALGFTRRYSTNRKWPTGDIWMLGKLYGWVSTGWGEHSPVGVYLANATKDDELLRPMGDRLDVEENIDMKRKMVLSEVNRLRKKL